MSRRNREPADRTADLLKQAFRRHACGVAVVTARDAARPVGLTVTSLASVSLEPALLSFNIARTASAWPVVETARHVGIHVLGAHQDELARLFARSGADRFGAGTDWLEGPHGVPVLASCPAWLVARVDRRVVAGDSVLVLAEVTHGGGDRPDEPPLVHHAGGFLPTAAAHAAA